MFKYCRFIVHTVSQVLIKNSLRDKDFKNFLLLIKKNLSRLWIEMTKRSGSHFYLRRSRPFL